MKLILIRIIRTLMISLSLLLLGLSLAYIVYPQYTGIRYNYAPSLWGRMLGASFFLFIVIPGIFPYKILKKGTFLMGFMNFLIYTSLFVPGILFYSYYSRYGQGFPVAYAIVTLTIITNIWAFTEICGMGN